jgi:hypothetical protein
MRPAHARTAQARTAQAPRPAPARTALRRLLACAGRAVRATHAARVPF